MLANTDSIHIVTDAEGTIYRINGELDGRRFTADRYGWIDTPHVTVAMLRATTRFGFDVRDFAESVPAR